MRRSAGVCLSLLISAVVMGSGDATEATASQQPVRHSPSLCPAEQQYVDLRKQAVLQALRRLHINCSQDSVPHIALLASGGGQRAAVSLLGSLYQLEKDGLLDALLYLGGVSGSTWSMASLYSDPEWSSNMEQALSRLSGEGLELHQALGWLNGRAQQGDLSLADVWGVLTSAGVMKQLDQRRLSDEANRNVTNPYPVYSAVDKHCFSQGPVQGKWFELSPHESGFTELQLFVNTSLLGSSFHRGQLQEQRPEMDMVTLQGVLGCAVAHEELLVDFTPPWLQAPGFLDVAQDFLRVYNTLDKLTVLTRASIPEPSALSQLDKLQQSLREQVSQNKSALLESAALQDRRGLFQQWSSDLLMSVTSWTSSLEDGPFKEHVSVLTNHILPLVLKWDWGSTGNFLYQYEDSSVPSCLLLREWLQLVDAGPLINMPYPPFLGRKRDIDLIVALEFSAGDMFETLTLARDYAAQVEKPFPAVEDRMLEDREWPQHCYVLEGKDQEPSIVYLPLFNRRNCKDAAEFKVKMEEFSTFQGPFSQQMVQALVETARSNMRNSRETVLREIQKAAERRRRLTGRSAFQA